MSTRKKHNMKARMERAQRSLVATSHAAVVNLDPSGLQILINLKNCRQITSRTIVDAVCDIAHHWTIYISVMCEKPDGMQYNKSVEVAPQGNYRAEHITEVIETWYLDLRSKCNPNHIRAAGWIAIPSDTSLDKDQAGKVFAAVGASNTSICRPAAWEVSAMAEEMTGAAKHSKDYRGRKKAEAERLGIEEVKTLMPAGIKMQLAEAMTAHGYEQVQELWQDMQLSWIAADPEERARRLKRPDAPAFRISPKLARQFEAASMAELKRDPECEVIDPFTSSAPHRQQGAR